MEPLNIFLIVLAVLIALFPVAFVWYMCIGGICVAIRKRATSAVGEDVGTMVCSTDADCPEGYICIGGRCVPAS